MHELLNTLMGSDPVHELFNILMRSDPEHELFNILMRKFGTRSDLVHKLTLMRIQHGLTQCTNCLTLP